MDLLDRLGDLLTVLPTWRYIFVKDNLPSFTETLSSPSLSTLRATRTNVCPEFDLVAIPSYSNAPVSFVTSTQPILVEYGTRLVEKSSSYTKPV